MRTAHIAALAVLLPISALPAAPTARAGDRGPRPARVVVERNARDLSAALRLALRPALRDRRRDVALVVDVTPYTAKSGDALTKALLALEADAGDVGGWRIAPLGGRFGERTTRPTGLVTQLADVLADETPSRNTLLDLRRTLGGFDTRGGVVVYLADWHADDDHELERFVHGLRRRGQVFSVVGSEAAFTRGWNDGLFAGPTGTPDPRGGPGSYDPRIGRDVFGRRDPGKPWHGGATGYPHLPWEFRGIPWATEFSGNDGYGLRFDEARADGETDETELEDLRERMRALREDERAGAAGVYPLPSGWGPYGLTRAAAETGGRYVLWSWNPRGRSDVVYDYSRLDLFPPDLRPRESLLADVRRRPLARALMTAWHLVSQPNAAVAAVGPPVEDDLRTPQPVGETRLARCLACEWIDWADVMSHRRLVGKTIEALDDAVAVLDRALRKAGEPTDDIERRLSADADLFRHTLLVLRFSLGEIDEVNRLIGNDAWDQPDRYPMAARQEFLLRGGGPRERQTAHRRGVRHRARGAPRRGPQAHAHALPRDAVGRHGRAQHRAGVPARVGHPSLRERRRGRLAQPGGVGGRRRRHDARRRARRRLARLGRRRDGPLSRRSVRAAATVFALLVSFVCATARAAETPIGVEIDSVAVRREVRELVDRARRETTRLLGADVETTGSVHLHATWRDWSVVERRLTNGAFASHGAFTSHATGDAHVALQPELSSEHLERYGLPDLTRRLIAHETAHVVTFARSKRPAVHPDWLAEGVACVIADRVLGVDDEPGDDPVASTRLVRCRRLLAEGRLPRIAEVLDDRLPALDRNERYAFWWLVARALVRDAPGAVRAALAVADDGTAEVARAVRHELEGGLADVDNALVAELEAVRPRWEVTRRSLDARGDELVHAAFDEEAVAWRELGPPGSGRREITARGGVARRSCCGAPHGDVVRERRRVDRDSPDRRSRVVRAAPHRRVGHDG